MRIVPELLCTTAFRTVMFATCCCCPSSIPYQVDLGLMPGPRNPSLENVRLCRLADSTRSHRLVQTHPLSNLSFSTFHPTYLHSKFSFVLMSPMSDDYSGTHPIFRVVSVNHFSVCHLVHTNPPGFQLQLLSKLRL